MVVGRGLVILWILTSMAAAQAAEEGHVRAWVDRTDVQAEKPFRLFVEISGESLSPPRFEKTDALILNVYTPHTFRLSMTVFPARLFARRYIFKFSFITSALSHGVVFIPSIFATLHRPALTSTPLVFP